MKLESLVTADQPRCGEYVLGSCTRVPGSEGKKRVRIPCGALEHRKQTGRRAAVRLALKGSEAFRSLSSHTGDSDRRPAEYAGKPSNLWRYRDRLNRDAEKSFLS